MNAGSRETADILRELEVLEGARCAGCRRALCGHHALVALVMGFKSAPRCAGCLASALDLGIDGFLDQVGELVRHRDCYRSGWAWADGREGVPNGERPPCLQPPEDWKPRSLPVSAAPTSGPTEDAWDAGGMGCGDLVLELRIRLGRLAAGGILRLVAQDPGAPEDIPAWCRLTGHTLLEAKHPEYTIRRREDPR
jgi:tRNA 2-thiouridine synthesizing protein A